jgi:hypothetical protein
MGLVAAVVVAAAGGAHQAHTTVGHIYLVSNFFYYLISDFRLTNSAHHMKRSQEINIFKNKLQYMYKDSFYIQLFLRFDIYCLFEKELYSPKYVDCSHLSQCIRLNNFLISSALKLGRVSTAQVRLDRVT